MRAHFGLPSVIGELMEGRPPIHVRFEIPYFTVSGIQVRSNFLYITFAIINALGCMEIGIKVSDALRHKMKDKCIFEIQSWDYKLSKSTLGLNIGIR